MSQVQYGCGFSAPADWLNFDSSLTLRWERIPFFGRLYTKNSMRFPANVQYGNIVEGLPVADGSCHLVYASHVLEHLSHDDCQLALRNTFSMLRPGGVFRLVVPDLETAARRYVQGLVDGAVDGNTIFLDSTGLGYRSSRQSFGKKLHETLHSRHLWMWDFHAMRSALEKNGFVSIRRCAFNDSDAIAFRSVESLSRFQDALAIECRRPPL